MPLGIIDAKLGQGAVLTGTVHLVRTSRTSDSDHDAPTRSSILKRTIYMGVDTVLVPQPSLKDPNDPLLWTNWRKEAAFWVIFFNTIIFASLPGPMLSPATFALGPILGVSITKVAELSGYHLLVVAAIGFVVPRFYFKPSLCFLFAAITGTLGTAVCIAGSHRSQYNTIFAGRMIQGLGATAWESLALAAIGDLFYLHERGWRIAMVVASSACTVSMTSIISGVMAERLGYRVLFIVELPFNLAGLIITVALLPEMQFKRPAVTRQDIGPSSQSNSDAETTAVKGHLDIDVTAAKNTIAETGVVTVPKKTLAQMLAPWSRQTYTDKNIIRLLAELFVNFINPAVLWILTISAVLNACFVASSYILSQIWSMPPYNLNIEQNGFFWAGALIGGLFAIPVGSLCDWSAMIMSKWNGGVYEAEFRIPVNILGAALCGLGWFLLMWVVDHPSMNGYFLGAFCLGCIAFSISVPSTSAGLYIL
ncbi:major facilitator superfamily transporter [Colletotrichum simmondsii]|uniref:Major facilitator superfamily transporter n=1 Tax=Colletotrichum simmondsii TaxID=703756 RepID=A0A135SMH4_9PEZI|nr:major facilitator superfamily transporter [Colletotrichum simmondsii]